MNLKLKTLGRSLFVCCCAATLTFASGCSLETSTSTTSGSKSGIDANALVGVKGEVLGISVKDPQTGEELQSIQVGQNLSVLHKGQSVALVAIMQGDVGSVEFELSGAEERNHVENVSPYALFGDISGDYNSWEPEAGTYRLKVTSYAEKSKKGKALDTAMFILSVGISQKPVFKGNEESKKDTPETKIEPKPEEPKKVEPMKEEPMKEEPMKEELEEMSKLSNRLPRFDKRPYWADSFSYDGKCYCDSEFDHGLTSQTVMIDGQTKGVPEVCDLLGKPSFEGPVTYFNDIQCGHGPANEAFDEKICPGIPGQGEGQEFEGGLCNAKGPKWDLNVSSGNNESVAGKVSIDMKKEEEKAFSPPKAQSRPFWADSFSIGESCYCDSEYDHGLDDVSVTIDGKQVLVSKVCAAIGNPIISEAVIFYNDIQCGNGPANNAEDERVCPGIPGTSSGGIWDGPGCDYKGPKWNISSSVKDKLAQKSTDESMNNTPSGSPGFSPPHHSNKPYWADSYSVNGRCYCDTEYDHNLDKVSVSVKGATYTIKDVCSKVGSAEKTGKVTYYNDVQCGNGPANDAHDEQICPGIPGTGSGSGYEGPGCGYRGPSWNLDSF